MNHYVYDRNKIKQQKSTRDVLVDSLVKWQFEFSFLTVLRYILLDFSLLQYILQQQDD